MADSQGLRPLPRCAGIAPVIAAATGQPKRAVSPTRKLPCIFLKSSPYKTKAPSPCRFRFWRVYGASAPGLGRDAMRGDGAARP